MSTITDTEELLIGLVGNRPCLYEKTHPDYKNSRVRESNWTEISEIIKKTGPECIKLWTKVRQQYMAFLRRLKQPSGSGTKHRPQFRHELAMGFLKDSVEPDESTLSNLETDDQWPLNTQDMNTTVSDNIDEDAESNGTDDKEEEGRLPEDAPSKKCPRAKSQPDGRSHTNKRKLDSFDKELLELVKAEDDEYDLYGKMLGPKLRKIAEHSRKEFLQLQFAINELVLKTELSLIED